MVSCGPSVLRLYACHLRLDDGTDERKEVDMDSRGEGSGIRGEGDSSQCHASLLAYVRLSRLRIIGLPMQLEGRWRKVSAKNIISASEETKRLLGPIPALKKKL